MRTTYHKITNVITVELTESEVTKYLGQDYSGDDLRSVENHYELSIPCTVSFYLKTQRQKGGHQPWSPDELRNAIRGTVANRLVSWSPDLIETDKFNKYKELWGGIYQQLLRNVRLKFPSPRHPRPRLHRDEYHFRKKWRGRFVK